ncbi:MAG: MarR family transcriptional regulator [Acidihalobacter sp.]|jgi:MarR family transcriptional regulator, transcriptional regulator for hemolysin
MESRPEEQLGAKLGETARVWRGLLDKRLRPLGLSQTRWMAILHLSKTRDGLAQTELAARMGISHASLSPQIDRLVEDGWVERRSREEDRRCKTIHLTEQARTLSHEIKQTAAKLRSELFEGLGDEDIRSCERVLAHILRRAHSL